MDRTAWLADQRRIATADFDTIAPSYDSEDVEITPTHRHFVDGVLERSPSAGRILDAACGTGKYFGMILAAGRDVVGVDQSSGMLAVAQELYPSARTEPVGLQELTFTGEFDAAICVDAMENVFPEDWPLVVDNLKNALKPSGDLYFTVETKDEGLIADAYAEASKQGLPVFQGEYLLHGYYHYYPSIPQVRRWIDDAGLDLVEEGDSQGDGYGYHHLLTRRREP